MTVKLYVIPSSIPSIATELMLRLKGIDYKRVDLATYFHRPTLRLMGFPGKTVPAMKIDGRKVQGSREISRALDEIKPDPPLLTSDAVEEAERWGDELQDVPRRLLWWALIHMSSKERTEASRRFLQGYRLGLPIGIAARTTLPIAKASARHTNTTDETVRNDLATLPEKIDRVDALLAEGVIGGEQPNAADFQIAGCVRLLLGHDDLKDLIEGRPAAEHARRIWPAEYDPHIPAVFPAGWVPSRAAA